MYVKVMGTRPRALAHEQEARLFTTGPSVNYGTLIVEESPSKVCWADEVGVEANALTHFALKPHDDPDGVGSVEADGKITDRPWWLVRYAWWWASEKTSAFEVRNSHNRTDHSIEMIISQGDMYILNDSGDTVERVR